MSGYNQAHLPLLIYRTMAWRTFAVFLLALNLAAFTFAWVNPKVAPMAPRATEPNVTSLVLLSERDAEQMRAASLTARAASGVSAAEPVSEGEMRAVNSTQPSITPTTSTPVVTTASPATLDAQYCERIGPLRDAQAAASLRARLGTLSAAAEVKEVEEMQIRGYWVYLPQSADREAALALARQLAAGGIRDYYVVTAGANENTISLGMFQDRINADKRIQQIAALGFNPKRIERGDLEKRYWVEYRAATDSKRAVGALRGVSELTRETIFCNAL